MDRDYPRGVAQLKVNAINPRMERGVVGLLLGMVRTARWELTCGFCRERFRNFQFLLSSTAVCPFCGTSNLLRRLH
jgi:rRNA maturation endonuclease Nob1